MEQSLVTDFDSHETDTSTIKINPNRDCPLHKLSKTIQKVWKFIVCSWFSEHNVWLEDYLLHTASLPSEPVVPEQLPGCLLKLAMRSRLDRFCLLRKYQEGHYTLAPVGTYMCKYYYMCTRTHSYIPCEPQTWEMWQSCRSGFVSTLLAYMTLKKSINPICEQCPLRDGRGQVVGHHMAHRICVWLWLFLSGKDLSLWYCTNITEHVQGCSVDMYTEVKEGWNKKICKEGPVSWLSN